MLLLKSLMSVCFPVILLGHLYYIVSKIRALNETCSVLLFDSLFPSHGGIKILVGNPKLTDASFKL